MININKDFYKKEDAAIPILNRGLQYGDAVFETLRLANNKIFFWEDHYFRLMATMRMLRMEIPMNFTLEFLQEEILKTAKKQTENTSNSFRVKLLIWRSANGKYTPESNDVSFAILCEPLATSFYVLEDKPYEVELFKDYYIAPDLLGTLKTTNRIINVLGSIFAKENSYQNCLLLNTEKKVVEALNGNIFIRNGKTFKTPPLKDGCIQGIIRKQLLKIFKSTEAYTVVEESVSPFELQKADELFITNAIVGIQPVTHYRKKQFETTEAKNLLAKLNTVARTN
jgi:branched-chain amino acid aminotransferase